MAPALEEDTSNRSISRGHESDRGPIGCIIGLQNLPRKGSRKLPRFQPMPCHNVPSQQLAIHRWHLDHPRGRQEPVNTYTSAAAI